MSKRKGRGKDLKPRKQRRWTKEAREEASKKARKLTDDQELEMVQLITSQNGPGLSVREATWAATHARLSEGMCGNKHGLGQQFPKAIANRWKKERRGKGNPNWKGGPKARHRLGYKELVASVLKRDKYQCAHCRSHKQLVVHHIVPEDENPKLLFEISNCKTLYRSCHMKHHQQEGDINEAHPLLFVTLGADSGARRRFSTAESFDRPRPGADTGRSTGNN